jgi:hypothetical protein
MKSIEYCNVITHAKRKPLRYQSTRYKKSTKDMDTNIDVAINTDSTIKEEKEQYHPK